MGVVGKLSDARCRTAGAGHHGDGGGLWLQVRQGAGGLTRSWLYRYSVGRKQHWIGFGSYPTVTLQRAREKAWEARRLRADGGDPLEAKRSRRAAVVSRGPIKSMTFQECAHAHIERHEVGWAAKYSRQQVQLLTDYAFPVIGSKGLAAVTTQDVLAVLTPLWTTMPVSANRLRNRIELILDAARAAGHIPAENQNVARWRGHLDKLLPRPSKVAAVEHHASTPYRDVPVLMEQLRQRDAISALALQFICLTACRASECLGMEWAEINLDAKLWVIPARRMKGRREHRVPLNDATIEVLKSGAEGDRPFPISIVALQRLRERLGMSETTHGLRSSFRVWCAECTNYPAEIAEQCLAHVTGSAVEQAYQRSDLLDQRRQLMQRWADYVTTTATVVPLRVAS